MADGASSAPAPAPAPVAARGRPTAAPGPIELSDEKTVQTLATPDSFGGLGERLVAEPRRRRLHRLAAMTPLPPSPTRTTSLPRLMPPLAKFRWERTRTALGTSIWHQHRTHPALPYPPLSSDLTIVNRPPAASAALGSP